MIELHTLGALSIVAPDAPNAADAYTRPKPLGLLVYLAAARPRGFQSQDSLLAVFWPDADVIRSQQSLRQALHLLRKSIGDEVISRRGRAELGIDSRQLTCDAVEFETQIARGQPERALEKYQGEFLAGFHIQDAPEFERWVSLERTRLHNIAVDAARTLVSQSDDAADSVAAARWARRWVELAPFDECAVVCAMSRHAAAGEDRSALKAFERFEASLTEDGEVPSSESTLLAAAARERLSKISRGVEPALRKDVGRIESKADSAVESDAIRSGDVKRRWDDVDSDVFIASSVAKPSLKSASVSKRWRIPIAAVALLTVTAVAVGPRRLAAALRSATNGELSQPKRIAILPFTVRGSAGVAYLREGMVDLLASKLDNADGISTVNAGAILAYERTHDPITHDPRAAASIAREFNAGQFVVGTVIEVGSQVAINASLYDDNGKLRASSEGSAPDESQILPVIDKVARELLASEFGGAQARLEHVAATTTNSLPALKEFLEGERAIRAGQQTAAADAFQRAVGEDSTFALAHYRLSTTVLWSEQPEVVQRSIEAAERFSDRLPQHERLALEARGMIGRGAVEDADRLYRDIVAKYPDDIDAWNQLGESLFHTGPSRGRPIGDSRAEFEQVLRNRADDGNALLHLARLATLDKRSAEVISLTDRALRQKPEREAVLELRGLRAAATNDSAALRILLDDIRRDAHGTGIDDDVRLLAWRVATYSDNPARGATILAAFPDSRSSVHLQLLSHSALAHMHAAAGQWDAAQSELDTVEKLDAHYAAEMRANFALAWPASLNAVQRSRVMRALDNTNSSGTLGKSADLDSMGRARRQYLSGTLALENGDTTLARTHQRALAVLARENNADADLAEHLAHQLSARILSKYGHNVEALAEVEAGWPRGSPRAALPFFQGDVYTQAHERFFRAELLMALRRNAEAQRWFETVVDDQGEALLLSAKVHVALGKLAEASGSETVAIAQYRRALTLWAHADPLVMALNRSSETHLEELLTRQGQTRLARLPAGEP